MTGKEERGSRINLLYIVGSGRSGSTLLDMILGSHSQAFGLGEVANPPTLLRLNWKCSCGEDLNRCAFWRPVLGDLDESSNEMLSTIGSLTPTRTRWEKMRQMISIGGKTEADMRHLELECRIFDRISYVAHSRWLVDSSKDFNRLLYLRKEERFKTRAIYLVRDGRGYVYAHKGPPVLETFFRKDRRPLPVWRSSVRWFQANLCCLIAAQRVPRRDRMLVRYEDPTGAPLKVLRKICDFMEIPFGDGMLRFRAKANHNIGGNRMRFGGNEEIRTEERWRKELSARDRAVVLLIGGILNLTLSRMDLH